MRILIFAFIVGTALAGSLRSNNKCALTCPTITNPKFKYDTGKTYVYDYSVETNTAIIGLSDDEAKTKLSAQVEIEVHGDCERKLKLRNVNVDMPQLDSRKISEYQRTLTSKDLMFSDNGGHFKSVCPAPEDPIWAVNIKRGILSAIQNSMPNLNSDFSDKEVDVAGNCITNYKVSSDMWGKKTIIKTKNIDSCTRRNGNRSVIQSDHYFLPHSGIQHVPIVESSTECKQGIKNDIVDSVICEETHKFRPFSNKENGASTKVVSKLTYKSSRQSISSPLGVSERRCLLLEHTDDEDQGGSVQDTLNVLYTICRNSKNQVKLELPELFNELVTSMLKLSSQDVQTIYEQLKSNRICTSSISKSLFLDALPVAANPGSLSLMTRLISQNSVNPAKKMSWLTSLAFTPRPTEESIEAVMLLLPTSTSQMNTDAVLSISSMVHTYCRLNTECEKTAAVTKVISSLQRLLGYKCRTNSEKETKAAIVALKAFGNLGRLGASAATIKQCYDTKIVKLPIRIAAIEAYRRAPCTLVENQNKIDLFKKVDEDVELRIAAYSSAMQCIYASMSGTQMGAIVEQLKSEPSNQVASFVWSHLTNIRESSSPVKRELRTFLMRFSLNERKPNDFRKFSRNYEWSTMNDKYNVGADLDSNVIFTPRSYLPQSFMTNATVNLFGYSVNMFEIGGRVQGLDHYVEKFLAKHNAKESFENLKKAVFEKLQGTAEEIQNSIPRTKRETYSKPHMQNIDRQVNDLNENSPYGSLYIKVFGNELKFVTLADLQELKNTDISLPSLMTKMAEGVNIDIAKTVIFGNHRFSVPTIAGMPVRIALNATVSLGAKVKGKFDLRNMLGTSKSVDIDGSIQPSGAMMVTSAMYVDTGISRHGLKMKVKYHSADVISGKMFMKDGQLKLRVDTPNENTEVINMESSMYLVTPSSEKPLTMKNTETYTYENCTDTFDKPFGMKLCLQMNIPKPFMSSDLPYPPLNGPRKFRIYAQKSDTTMRSYEVNVHVQKPKVIGDDMMLKAEFNTPGSQIDRYTMIMAQFKNKNTIGFEIKSPIVSMKVDGSLTGQAYVEKAKLDVMVQGSQKYDMKAEFNIQKMTGSSYIYSPTIRIEVPETNPINLQGRVGYHYKDQTFHTLEVDVKSSQHNSASYAIKGALKKEGSLLGEFDIMSNLSMTTPKIETNLDAGFSKNSQGVDSDVVFWYKPAGENKHVLAWNTKLKNLSTESLRKYKTNMGMTSSLYPEYNWQTSWAIQMTKGHIENELTIGYGEHMDWDDQKIKYLEVFEYGLTQDNKLKSFNIRSSLKQKSKQIDYALQSTFNMESEDGLPNITFDSTFSYAPTKVYKTLVKYNLMSKSPLSINNEIKVTTPERELIYREKINQRAALNGFDNEMYLQWQTGKYVDHKYQVTLNKLDSGVYDIKLSGELTGSSNKYYPINYSVTKTTKTDVTYEGHLSMKNVPLYKATIVQSLERFSWRSTWEGPETKGFSTIESGPNFHIDINFKKHLARLVAKLTSNVEIFHVDLLWDKKGENATQYGAEVKLTRTPKHMQAAEITAMTKLRSHGRELINVNFVGSEEFVYGPHRVTVKVHLPEQEVRRCDIKYQLSSSSIDMSSIYMDGRTKKLESKFAVTVTTSPVLAQPNINADIFIKSEYEPVKDFFIKYRRQYVSIEPSKFRIEENSNVRVWPGLEADQKQSVTITIQSKGVNDMSVTVSGTQNQKFTYSNKTKTFDQRYNGQYKNMRFTMNSALTVDRTTTYTQSLEMVFIPADFKIVYSIKAPEVIDLELGGDYKLTTGNMVMKVNAYCKVDGKNHELNFARDTQPSKNKVEIVVKTPYENMQYTKLHATESHVDPLIHTLDLEWGNNQKLSYSSQHSNTTNYNRYQSQLTSTTTDPVKFDFTASGDPSNGYLLDIQITKAQSSLFILTLNDKLTTWNGEMTALFKINDVTISDIKFAKQMTDSGPKSTLSLSGLFSPISVEGQLNIRNGGYYPTLKACFVSTSQCFKVDMSVLPIKWNENEKDYNLMVEINIQTNPMHVMAANFDISNEQGLLANRLVLAYNKRLNQHVGYSWMIDSANETLEVELLTSVRKMVLSVDHTVSGSDANIIVKVSGNKGKHALMINFLKSHETSSGFTIQMGVTHPVLTQPISVQIRKRQLTDKLTVDMEINYSANKTKNLAVNTEFSRVNSNHTMSVKVSTPNSKRVLINFHSHLGITNSLLTWGAMGQWQPIDLSKQPKEIFLYFLNRPETNSLDFYYRHPGRVIDVNGNYKKSVLSNGEYGMLTNAVATNNNVKKNVVSEINLRKLLATLLVTDVANPSEGFKLSAFVNDKKTLNLVLESHTNGKIIKDIHVEFHRNNSHLVHTQIKWSPMYITEAISGVRTHFHNLWYNMVYSDNYVIKEMITEVYDKVTVVTDAVMSEIVLPLVGHAKEDGKEIYAELEQGWTRFTAMVKMHNEKLEAIIEREKVLIKENLKKAFAPLVLKLKEWEAIWTKKWEEFCEKFEEKYPEMYQSIKDSVNQTFELFEKEYERMKNLFSKGGVKSIFEDICIRNNINWEEITQSMKTKKEKLSQWFSGVSEKLKFSATAVKVYFIETLASFYESNFVKKILVLKSYLIDTYGEYMYRLNQKYEGIMTKLDEYPEIKTIVVQCQESMMMVLKSYENLSLMSYFDYATLMKTIIPYEPIVNIKKGIISLDMALPYTTEAVKEWSNSQWQSKYEQSSQTALDTYHKIKSNSDPKKWIPPFEASASIIGSQHYLTFDKKHFDFVGACSYVLVKDFKDGNFTVIAHYDQNRRISLSVLVAQKKIDIAKDFKVYVDGQEVDIPIKQNNVLVSRRSNTVTVSNMKGVTVECDWHYDVCTVHTSGWYFGKTAGLFGRYDNEQHTDMKKPNGEPVTEIYKLAQAWSVSSKCSTLNNLAVKNQIVKSSSLYQLCERYFNAATSSLRSCFSVVDPKQYMEMCASAGQDQKTMCSVSAAYMSACRQKDISVNMPDECVTCDLRRYQSSILKRGASVQIRPDPRRKSADIVYIIENRQCNEQIIRKLLNNPPTILSRELRSQRIYSRVSVVSYGGKSQPQIHTARGKNFYSFRDMVLAMKAMYNIERAPENEYSDAFDAIRFASQMDFQPTAAKVFVLVKCSACDDGKSISYADTQQMLLQQGIVLHVMTPDAILAESGNIGKSKKMFGISSSTVYSQKDITQKALVGSPDLITAVSIRKDHCIALAQSVNGTFFTELPLIKYTSLEKNFDLVFSRQIVSTAVPQSCQNCDCVSTFDGVGIIMCTPCHIPSPLQPTKVYQSKADMHMLSRRIYARKQ